MTPSPSDTSPPSEGEIFLREVDEEYRRSQLLGFWSRYGRWIILAVGIGLLALAAFLYWRQEQVERLNRQGDALSAVLQDIDANTAPDKITPRLKKLEDTGAPGYRVIARLLDAGLAFREGDVARARDIYQKVSQDPQAPDVYRKLAQIELLLIDFDKTSPQENIAHLQPLAKVDSPWFGTAGEMLAVAYLQAGESARARDVFAQLSDGANVPGLIRARAKDMMTSLDNQQVPAAPQKAGNGGADKKKAVQDAHSGPEGAKAKDGANKVQPKAVSQPTAPARAGGR